MLIVTIYGNILRANIDLIGKNINSFCGLISHIIVPDREKMYIFPVDLSIMIQTFLKNAFLRQEISIVKAKIVKRNFKF